MLRNFFETTSNQDASKIKDRLLQTVKWTIGVAQKYGRMKKRIEEMSLSAFVDKD